MKLKCIIVDDEPVARKLLEEYIEDVEFLELKGKAENPLKANTLLNDSDIDLMFLDINMPKLSGIEFLRTSHTLPLTIMTTAYAEYAVEGFELEVLDYLVKPFSFERFLKAANKAKEFYTLKRNAKEEVSVNYFFVKCQGKIEKVYHDELLYIEAMLNYVILHTETRKMIVYLTIKGITEQLPSSKFLKVHKSFIINTGKVKSIEGNQVDLGSAKVTISQNMHDAVIREILQDRMMRR